MLLSLRVKDYITERSEYFPRFKIVKMDIFREEEGAICYLYISRHLEYICKLLLVFKLWQTVR